MTLGDAAVEAVTDPRAYALGYGKRRSAVFWAWWYGATLSITGTVDTSLSALLGQGPDRGIFVVVLGCVTSGLGWLLTSKARFSSQPSKPASDVARLQQAIQMNPGAVKVFIVITAALVTALALFKPGGTSPEAIPFLGLVAAAGLSITTGMAYSGWLMKNCDELYGRWLERRASSPTLP